MDIEKLIERFEYDAKDWAGDPHIKKDLTEAATALSTLQIENQALRNSANGFKAENEKLRAEVERMAACVHYKPGGLCGYGGDDPANVCVLGPYPHEMPRGG